MGMQLPGFDDFRKSPVAKPERNLATLTNESPGAIELTPVVNQLPTGTGGVVQRGPTLKDVFTFNVGGRQYLMGLQYTFGRNSIDIGVRLSVAVLVFGVSVLLLRHPPASLRDSIGWPDSALIFLAVFEPFMLLWAGSSLRDLLRRRHCQRDGKLILGDVISAAARTRLFDEEDEIRVRYRVRTPEGHVLEGTQRKLVEAGTSTEQVPQTGDPIAVLYVDQDHLYIV